MNHLAHLFLAQTDINLVVGNFIADHVKGKQIEGFSTAVQEGIKMHRAIDAFTDSHPIVAKSKTRLYPKYRKYAAVIVDMYYDHFLAKNWKQYSPIPLSLFAKNAYRILESQEHTFPEKSKVTLYYMRKQDWLSNYATLDGLQRALNGLSNRASFDSKMDESVADLEASYEFFEEEFSEFFKALFERFASDKYSNN